MSIGPATANFVLLDLHRTEIPASVTAMLHIYDIVGQRSWSHPEEPTTEER
jgi:hypothetical protein